MAAIKAQQDKRVFNRVAGATLYTGILVLAASRVILGGGLIIGTMLHDSSLVRTLGFQMMN